MFPGVVTMDSDADPGAQNLCGHSYKGSGVALQ